MKSIYYSLLLLFGILLSSCQNGSFNDPVIPVPVSDFWYTQEPAASITGYIKLHGDQHGGYNPLPSSKIIVAWEMPNDPTRPLYVYGRGTYTKLANNNYSFTVYLRDTLPDFALLGKEAARPETRHANRRPGCGCPTGPGNRSGNRRPEAGHRWS